MRARGTPVSSDRKHTASGGARPRAGASSPQGVAPGEPLYRIPYIANSNTSSGDGNGDVLLRSNGTRSSPSAVRQAPAPDHTKTRSFHRRTPRCGRYRGPREPAARSTRKAWRPKAYETSRPSVECGREETDGASPMGRDVRQGMPCGYLRARKGRSE